MIDANYERTMRGKLLYPEEISDNKSNFQSDPKKTETGFLALSKPVVWNSRRQVRTSECQ